jgi:AraC-like DNA-binding protein
MKIDFDWFSALTIIIISQIIFAAGLLWFSERNRLSNRYLAILLVAISGWLIDYFCRVSGIYSQNANLYFMPIYYSFAFGPLVYFYVKSITNHEFNFEKRHLWHFIPVVFQGVLYWFLYLKSYKFKNWYWQNIHKPYTYKLEFDGTWISLFIYLILSILLIRRYQTWVKENFSEVSKIHLNWLKVLLIILVVLCIQWFIEVILRDYYQIYFDYTYSIQILGFLALALGIAGLRQSNLEKINFIEDKTEPKVNIEIDQEILKKVKETMEQEKLFLNPTISLSEFAKYIKLPAKIVSQHINSGLQKSFNDFVNEYRVAEVKRRLKSEDLQKLTILGIAFESGFNSKTTFNRIFKDFTGKAPRDF